MKKIITLIFLLIALSVSVNAQTRPHWLDLKGRPVADILEYGAVPNSNTASARHANISAFNSAKASKKAVFIPEGNWYFDSTLSITGITATNSFLLFGVGKKASRIYSTASPAIYLEGTQNDNTSGQAIISNIGIFEASADNDQSRVGISAKWIYTNEWSNLYSYGFGTHIYLDTCYFNTVTATTFEGGTNGIAGYEANNNVVSNSWFTYCVFDLSGMPSSSIINCDVEPGGYFSTTGPIVGSWCKIYGNRFERVNAIRDMNFLLVAGDEASIYDNQFPYTQSELAKLNTNYALVHITGNHNKVEIPSTSFTYGMLKLGDTAEHNKITIQVPLKTSASAISLLQTTASLQVTKGMASQKNEIIFASEPGERNTTFRDLLCESKGIFYDIGSANTLVASSTLWTNVGGNTISTSTYLNNPVGWNKPEYDGHFFTVIATGTDNTKAKAVLRVFAPGAVATGTPISAVALIKNPGAKAAWFGTKSGCGEYVPPFSDWTWYHSRAIAGQKDIQAGVVLQQDLNKPNTFWTGTDTLYIGAISIVLGETPSYVGTTSAGLATIPALNPIFP